MKQVLFIYFIFTSFLFSLDLSDFDDRQKVLVQVKEVILKEEQIAKAYQEYILEKYELPSSVDDLVTVDFLGESFLDDYPSIFNSISIDSISTLSYALKETLKNDLYIKDLYESNTFRKNTFYSNDKISFVLKDDFAKHLLYLLSKQTSGIPDCTTNKKYCKTGDNIYIYDGDTHSSSNLLMYYNRDKFKTGPILITSDTSLQTSNEEFDFIPKGALLYDEDGTKYVKTIDSIEEVR